MIALMTKLFDDIGTFRSRSGARLGGLEQFAPEPLVEEADLTHRQRPRVWEPRIVATDLQEHLPVHVEHGVPGELRLGIDVELDTSASPNEVRAAPQPKKSFTTA